MGISSLLSRLTTYYKRHGFESTAVRVGLAIKRALFSNRTVVFYCDLTTLSSSQTGVPSSLQVERKRSGKELSPQELYEIISVWNPMQAQQDLEERFGKGASLWLAKFEDRLAGYGWTLRGHTIEPHYLPLGPNDVHLFDFYVFPQFRGRGMNPQLVTDILRSLAADGGGRAFIEAAAWNHAQLSSVGKTPFRRLGLARKLTILRRTIVSWDRNGAIPKQNSYSRHCAPSAEFQRQIVRIGTIARIVGSVRRAFISLNARH